MTERIDCLLIGYNEPDFQQYEAMVRSMGVDSGSYRDLNLNFVELDGQKYPPVALLNEYRTKATGQVSNLHCAEPLNLAVAYLSSYLQKRGMRTEHINVYQLEKERLAELLKTEVMAVAITTTYYVSPMPIIEIITFIRQHNRKVKIILGGPYVSNQCVASDQVTLEFLFKSLGADFYVNSSQGEYALYRVLDALKNNKAFTDIDNLIYKRGPKFVFTNQSVEENDLDECWVDWGLFDGKILGPAVQMRTARSCPFSCAFCGYPERAGKYTFTQVETFEKELNLLRDKGTVRNIAVIDDTFNVPQERFKEICQMMIKNNYGFGWYSYIRCQFLDRETVELMKASNCQGVFLGIESGSQQILEKMHKSAKIEDYKKGLALLKEHGILTFASFIVGFPGETQETVQETMDFIEETAPDFYRVQLWYSDPITPIMREKDKYQIEGQGFNWRHATLDFAEGCDLIDRMCCQVKNSRWLAQYNFDFWMIPTILGNGMKIEQYKEFVGIFDELLRQKVTKEQADTRALQERLLEVCKF